MTSHTEQAAARFANRILDAVTTAIVQAAPSSPLGQARDALGFDGMARVLSEAARPILKDALYGPTYAADREAVLDRVPRAELAFTAAVVADTLTAVRTACAA